MERKEPVFLQDGFPDCEEHFLCKQIGWAYEKEWRIVKKSNERKEANFFTYKAEDLACIIVGQKIDPKNLKELRKCISSQTPILKAIPGYRTFKIIMLPIDYQYNFDGSEVMSIADVKGLIEYLEKRGNNDHR